MATLFHKECTASYIKADSNFKIFNLRNEESQNKYYSVIQNEDKGGTRMRILVPIFFLCEFSSQ